MRAVSSGPAIKCGARMGLTSAENRAYLFTMAVPKAQDKAIQGLAFLLKRLFSSEQLLHWTQTYGGYDLHDELPGASVPPSTLATETVLALRRRDLVNHALFDSLRQIHPRRRREIEAERDAWHGETRVLEDLAGTRSDAAGLDEALEHFITRMRTHFFFGTYHDLRRGIADSPDIDLLFATLCPNAGASSRLLLDSEYREIYPALHRHLRKGWKSK